MKRSGGREPAVDAADPAEGRELGRALAHAIGRAREAARPEGARMQRADLGAVLRPAGRVMMFWAMADCDLLPICDRVRTSVLRLPIASLARLRPEARPRAVRFKSSARSPHLAPRRAAQHLGDAAAGAAGRAVGERVGGEEAAAPRISSVRLGHFGAAPGAHHEQRDVVAGEAREVGVDAEQLRRAGELDAGFLVELARERAAPPSRPSRRRRRGNASPAGSRAAPAARAPRRRARRACTPMVSARVEAPVALQEP